MPHSKVKRQRISKHLQKIIHHLKILKAQHTESLTQAKIIRHSKVTLRELRANYTPHHKKMPPNVLANMDKFHRIKSNCHRPLYIYGKDGGLIAYRTSLNDPDILGTLTKSLKALPRCMNHKFQGIDRGRYSTRHLTVWCAYAKKPFVSRELKEDEAVNLDFLNVNQKLWMRLSDILR